MKYIFTYCFIFISILSFSQQTQTIKGKVLDVDSRQALMGATIYINGEELIATTSDLDGNFRLEKVPVGRIEIICTYIGYEAYSSGLITLSSGKEMLLDIYLQEQITQTKEVVVLGKKEGLPQNESFQISTKSFTISETNRFAGSINDPGRVALNSPGVMANQDNNNDVIIRGNSAVGVLWRIEGIDVPNVNHFARPGSSGGGISALSPQLLSNSDFSTGAFPAEYGNASAGVFDIKYRKGNSEKYEFSVRAGVIGLNFGAEGPLNKNKKASYLFNYRYSTLGILNKVGLNVVSERTDNIFQDLAFNFNLPSKKKAYFTVFGLGGLSSEITDARKDTADWEVYQDRLQVDFVTNLGVFGGTWTQLLNDKSYVKTVMAFSYNDISDDSDTLSQNIDFTNISHFRNKDMRLGLASTYNLKIRPGLSMKTGFQAHEVFYKFEETKFNYNTQINEAIINGNGATTVLQPFIQFKYRPAPNTNIVGGFHGLYLALNNTYSIDPRISIQQKIGKTHSLTLAYGLQSQHLPMGSFFTEGNNNNLPNFNLKLLKSHHLVIAYEIMPASTLRLKAEPYFQYLFNLPITPQSGSTYMLLNERQGYAKDSLVSEGTGMNYGIDFSVEKFYSKNWFMTFNSSLFNSTYKTIDKDTYSSAYNNRFGISLMGGKEFQFKKDNSLEIGLRMQFSGGFRYTPIDVNASQLANEEVTIDSLAYTKSYKKYFRPDLRIAYKKNQKNYSWTLSLDLANVVNHKNILRQIYNKDENNLEYSYQMGLLPILAFQIDFFGKKFAKNKE